MGRTFSAQSRSIQTLGAQYRRPRLHLRMVYRPQECVYGESLFFTPRVSIALICRLFYVPAVHFHLPKNCLQSVQMVHRWNAPMRSEDLNTLRSQRLGSLRRLGSNGNEARHWGVMAATYVSHRALNGTRANSHRRDPKTGSSAKCLTDTRGRNGSCIMGAYHDCIFISVRSEDLNNKNYPHTNSQSIKVGFPA